MGKKQPAICQRKMDLISTTVKDDGKVLVFTQTYRTWCSACRSPWAPRVVLGETYCDACGAHQTEGDGE
jgi:hypothetical protein